MSEVSFLGLSRKDEEKIKIIADRTCEICGTAREPADLDLHLISRRCSKEEKRDPTLRVIITCRDCHWLIHGIPVPKKSQLIIPRGRNFFVRRDIRKYLGYKPKQWAGPDDTDLSEILDDDFVTFPAWSFRLSG